MPKGKSESRLVLPVILCAGAGGVAMALISFVARAKPWEQPQHPPPLVSAFLGISGFTAGVVTAALFLRLVVGDSTQRLGVRACVFLGLLYGILAPVLTGALIPPATVLLLLARGQIGPSAFLNGLVDSLFQMPWAAFTQGFLGVPSGLIAGAGLAMASWAIDLAGHSPNHRASAYGPWAIAVVLAALVVVFVLFGPASWLSMLGWGPG